MPTDASARPFAKRIGKAARRGVATLWLILMLPVLLILLCLVIETANLWLARQELEDSLESAALAGVQEWGEKCGLEGTATPREVARAFALENTVRGNGVVLLSNFDAGSIPNQNKFKTGDQADLVFGSITQKSPTVIFDPNLAPGCAFGPVAIDATGNSATNFMWGINFKDEDPLTPDDIEIRQVTINLRGGLDNNAQFIGTPILSNNSVQAVPGQNDVSGLTNLDITFSISNSDSVLTIDFVPGSFVPGDRMRFGAETGNLNHQPSQANPNSGDAVGQAQVTGTITFAIDGVVQTPVPFTFVNTTSNIILGPAPYLVPPGIPTSGAGSQNLQSFVEIPGANGRIFAVRATQSVTVKPVCGSLMGAIFGDFTVQADTVAEYDADEKIPRVIRVDQFIP